MGYRFSRADVEYLRSAAGVLALAAVDRHALTSASLVGDLQRVHREYGERTAALVETVRLRRRAAAKLDRPGEWLYTDDALQQATPSAVARHRARRLAGRAVHDVTCSIGAELVALHEVCPAVIGSDLDEVRLAMAAHNLSEAGNVLLARADALIPCTTGTVVIADPARRADGRRTHDPAKLQPPLPDLLDAYRGRDLVVKCAPGLDFDSFAPRGSASAHPVPRLPGTGDAGAAGTGRSAASGMVWEGEVEVVSLDGAVREACLWSAGLTEPGITRRATVLRSDGSGWSLTDAEADDIPERAPGEWIIDPDGAVVRAGLVRHYAAKHGLWQLDPRIAYLTGDSVPAGVRGFRVLDRFDFREKPLRAELHRRDCGPLEILTRGVDLDPDALRARLKPRGAQPFTLVITRIGRTATVFLCETPPAR
ncbi:THUMP-like domain-containing protein [Nocardia blacklockiae]|uniref:THUMP-like domain-containing protein n=1 Tax=Nocardia blacklockiae TaxID=480036 RepID=UPI00189363EA|nr:class I SAM-dependent methyltransferase [Nocardia blacklockiae]MBF6176503.1 class I SAM-dependent methyltransferase [Nocardia blacklockiae]